MGSGQKVLTVEFCHKSTSGIATAVGEQKGKSICVGITLDWLDKTPISPPLQNEKRYFFSRDAEGAQEISRQQHLGTWFRGGLGRAGGMVGLGDLGDLFSN